MNSWWLSLSLSSLSFFLSLLFFFFHSYFFHCWVCLYQRFITMQRTHSRPFAAMLVESSPKWCIFRHDDSPGAEAQGGVLAPKIQVMLHVVETLCPMFQLKWRSWDYCPAIRSSPELVNTLEKSFGTQLLKVKHMVSCEMSSRSSQWFVESLEIQGVQQRPGTTSSFHVRA